jgi:hypothetical protein
MVGADRGDGDSLGKRLIISWVEVSLQRRCRVAATASENGNLAMLNSKLGGQRGDRTFQDRNMDEDDHNARVDELYRISAEQLREARHPPALRVELARFFNRWTAAGFTTGELVDFLGVSSPSILERAGFTDDEAAVAMHVVTTLTDDEIATATP